MANEYLKPQIPLKDLNSENYFYPLTTLDQIIIGNSRLSAYLQENDGKLIFNNIDEDSVGGSINLDGIIANRTLFVENDSLLSSENIFINNDSLAINKTSITDGYNFEVNGNSLFNGLLKINTNGNTVTIGSANTEWCHFQNSANIPFYFNKQIQANSSFKIYNNNTILGAGYLELSGGTPYIDFHFNNSTADYTSRIIENASGRLYIPGKLAIAYTNDSYSLAAASFICNSWVRTKGSAGWYSEDYGGGWYMSDATWIRTYGSKSIYQNAGKIRTDGEMWSKYIRIVDNWIGVYENIDNTTKRFGYMQIDRSNNGWFRFAKEQGGGFLFTGGSVRCDSGFRVEGNNQGLYVKSTGFPTSAPSSAAYFEPLNMYDSGNNRIGTVGCGFEPGGERFTHIQCQRLINGTTHYTQFYMRINASGGRRLTCTAPLYGAVWNDYAEFRKGQMNNLKPGQVVTEIGNGEMKLANKKLQKGCKILSDTFGFAIGETKECKLPIAVSGRVLVYCDTPKEELEPGDCLCANYNGNAIKMTQEEIINYPDRIIGTVSEIPNYKIWHGGEYRPEIKDNPEDIKVDGRIWVYVR